MKKQFVVNSRLFKESLLILVGVAIALFLNADIAWAQKLGIDVETIKIDFNSVDRAIADGETDGFLKLHHKKGTDEIIGATIVASHAGEMISEVTTVIVHKIGSRDSSLSHSSGSN